MRCSRCGGRGKIVTEHSVYDPYERRNVVVKHEVSCSACGGRGEIPDPRTSEEDRSKRKLED